MLDGARRQPLILLGAFGSLIAMILVGAYLYFESRPLVDESGSGPGGETTEVFTVNGDWDLRWSSDCSSSLGSQLPEVHTCDFFLTVKEYADCSISTENLGITRHGGPDHGVIHYHKGGTFYFVVDSYGSWTFTVTGSGRGWGVGPAPHCTNDG